MVHAGTERVPMSDCTSDQLSLASISPTASSTVPLLLQQLRAPEGLSQPTQDTATSLGCGCASLRTATALPHGSITHICTWDMMLGSVQEQDPRKSVQTLPGKGSSNAHRLPADTLQNTLSQTSMYFFFQHESFLHPGREGYLGHLGRVGSGTWGLRLTAAPTLWSPWQQPQHYQLNHTAKKSPGCGRRNRA